MKRKTQKINKYMFTLLIEKGMDKFSVVELRDGFLKIMLERHSLDEARKYIYRQILAYEKKGWLAGVCLTSLYLVINIFAISQTHHSRYYQLAKEYSIMLTFAFTILLLVKILTMEITKKNKV